ncbi:unnamed protein product [Heligmosomoides polygyrus]|uniref:Uncharacterized protein n=1 Tax=Heligmosomoides polygyrus TaxID=6339 RepID=A0A183G236_HELPZ|nr:unnamed protein product [Heligmosomoides polygyrus]
MALGTIAEKEHCRNLLPKSAAAGAAASSHRSYIIEAKCTDNILFAGAAAVGTIVLVLQTVPIFMNNWVFLTEPRPINKTNENGEQIETTFHYNVGYFQVCRMYKNNQSGILYNEYEISKAESAYKCYLNPLLSREDLTDHSVASLAVIMFFFTSVRLGLPALLHVTGAFICCFAFVLGVTGHLRKTCYTLLSCINYICGSIILSTAVLMVVCVVDDELAPRMKPNSAGEPSKFSYLYGYPFFSAALSFLPVQICACLHAFLYFRYRRGNLEQLFIHYCDLWWPVDEQVRFLFFPDNSDTVCRHRKD